MTWKFILKIKMNKYFKSFVIVCAILTIIWGIFIIFSTIQWREANCEKVYYNRTIQVCAKERLQVIFTGKASATVRRCVEYKDTVIQSWRYKCPPKN